MSASDTAVTNASIERDPRVAWVDYAKGICIVMVVMMHSTLGVEAAAGKHGFMHLLVEFARPFRMPDFFLISGLFLARVIDRDWQTYLDRKVLHFAYFYVLWLTIQFAFKAPGFASDYGWTGVVKLYALSFIEPFGTLWFIWMLPVFFLVTKITHGRVPPLAIWIFGAALEIAHVATGWTVIDEFCSRFVYFYSGYLLAGRVFALADAANSKTKLAVCGLLVWATLNAALVYAGINDWPLISLALGFAGACAVIVGAVLLTRGSWMQWLRYCGEHSIVIYLAFFLPMAISRTLLLKTNVIPDIGLVSLIVTICGVMGALAIWWTVRGTRLNFLFDRPAMFKIGSNSAPSRLQAAE